MNLNDPEFAKWFESLIRTIVQGEIKKFVKSGGIKFWDSAKVATSASTAIIQVYINNSTTAVGVRNPRSFSLTAGQLVAIVYPNFKMDNMAYIDRIL